MIGKRRLKLETNQATPGAFFRSRGKKGGGGRMQDTAKKGRVLVATLARRRGRGGEKKHFALRQER